MRFDVKCVRDFLVERGFVYTVRGYRMRSAMVTVNGVGKCRRIRGKRSSSDDDRIRCKEDLVKWVGGSGFDSVDDWWDKIIEFCGDRDKWIYLVKICGKGEEEKSSSLSPKKFKASGVI